MRKMMAIAKRCSLMYFRDRSAVFFSLLAALIVLGLYFLFIRDTLLSNFAEMIDPGFTADAYILSGLMAVIPVMTAGAVLEIMVNDRSSKKDEDFLAAPVKPFEIAGGYILSSFIVGLSMGAVALTIIVAYLVASGCPMDAWGVLASVLLLIPSALSGSVIMFAITSFIRSEGAFSGFYTVVSVAIGFLTGCYFPMGSMPEFMGAVSSLTPASQIGALFRDALAGEALEHSLGGAGPAAMEEYRDLLGFDLSICGLELSWFACIAIAMAITAVAFAVAVAGIRRWKS